MMPQSIVLSLLLLGTGAAACSNSSSDEAPITISLNPRLYVGEWTGTWENTTMGSMGAVAFTVVLDGNKLQIDLDMDGNVFESMDPDEESFELFVDATEALLQSVTSDVYGTIEGSINGAAVVQIDGTAVPGTTDSFQVLGTLDGETMTFNVILRLENGSIMTGNATLDRSP